MFSIIVHHNLPCSQLIVLVALDRPECQNPGAVLVPMRLNSESRDLVTRAEPASSSEFQSGPGFTTIDAPRLDFVDALRGLAAVYVMITHVHYLPSPMPQVPLWASLFVDNGGTGVVLFFLVSAFSLCHSMKPRANEPDATLNFYVRRFFRIAPLFYVMVGAYCFRAWWLSGHLYYKPWQIVASASFLLGFIPGSNIVWAGWTIGVEVPFYVVFPLLFARLRSMSALVTAFLVSLFASIIFHEVVIRLALSSDPNFETYGLFRNAPFLVLGMLCWLVFDRYIALVRRPASVGAALIFGGLWIDHAVLHGVMNVVFPDPYYWHGVVYCLLLWGLAILPTRVLVNRATLFCGRISYSIYLIHPLVVWTIRPIYQHCYADGVPISISFLACVAITASIVLPLAWIVYHLVEVPGMRLGKSVLAWRIRNRSRYVTGMAD
jgi:peptidoglycan/LPS O-acetylase OafA/YrhL